MDVFTLLQQEGYMFRSCLTIGLTLLRKADLNDPGAYYSAFFQLSTGFERLLKSIVVIEHLAVHGQSPSEKELRRYGHNLLELIDTVAGRSSDSPAELGVLVAAGTLNRSIISILSDFAVRSRYFNLDALAGAARTSDPLDEWNRIVPRILAEDERPETVALLQPPPGLIGPARRMASMFYLRQQQELAAKHAIVRILRVLTVLRECLDEAERAGPSANVSHVPYMIEFLNFTYRTDAENLRKKRWP